MVWWCADSFVIVGSMHAKTFHNNILTIKSIKNTVLFTGFVVTLTKNYNALHITATQWLSQWILLLTLAENEKKSVRCAFSFYLTFTKNTKYLERCAWFFPASSFRVCVCEVVSIYVPKTASSAAIKSWANSRKGNSNGKLSTVWQITAKSNGAL